MSLLNIDETLLNCVIDGTVEGLSMAEIVPEPVGASRFLVASRAYSVLVSLYGERNGNLTMNFSEHTVRFLAAHFLGGEGLADLNEDTFDSVCEIGNIVAGRFKKILIDTPYQFNYISLPALIVGANYNLYHYRGISTACVEFEISEISVTHMRDKFFTSSISLMQK